MNLQHSLNISLVRLHTNKHPGTRGLTPTLVYFNIVPAHMIRTKSQKNVFIRIVDVENALTIFASTQSVCAQTRFHCTNNRISFLCVQIK